MKNQKSSSFKVNTCGYLFDDDYKRGFGIFFGDAFREISRRVFIRFFSQNFQIKRLAEAESKSINLNIVCLRFDAFIEKGGILFPLCKPIFTHGINNLSK